MAIIDRSIRLKGDKTFINFGPLGGYPLQSQWTIEAWIRIDVSDNKTGLILGLERSLMLERYASKTGPVLLLKGSMGTHVPFDYMPKSWYHVMISFDRNNPTPAGSIQFYINGQLVANFDKIPKMDINERIVVGNPGTHADSSVATANGLQVRDLKVWDVTVSKGGLYDPFKSPDYRSGNLIAHFPLDSDRFNSLSDQTRPFFGRAVNAPVEWVETPDYPMTVLQQNVTACEFSGNSGEYIRITPADPRNFDLADAMTIEAWIKLAPSPQIPKSPVLSCRDGFKGWNLFVSADALTFNIQINGEDSGMDGATVKLNPGLMPDTWYHIAVTFNAGLLSFFVNGVSIYSERRPGKKIYAATSVLHIGENLSTSSASGFQGAVAEVRYWNVALPNTYLQSGMFTTLVPGIFVGPGLEKALLGYWKLDATYSDEVMDTSVLRNHGQAVKVFRTLTHLPINGRRPFNEAERQQSVRKFWETVSVTDNSTIQSLKQELANKELAIRSYAMKYDSASDYIVELSKQNADLKTRLKDTDKSGSTLSTIIANANKEIRTAREALEKAGSDYKLGTVNLELMVIPAGDGDKFILPEYKDQLPTGDQLSKLELEFSPKDSGIKPVEEVAVPDLLGLTEVMAYRKLSNVGLTAEIKFQAVTESTDYDRVVRQIPQAGTLKKINTPVIVLIGKSS